MHIRPFVRQVSPRLVIGAVLALSVVSCTPGITPTVSDNVIAAPVGESDTVTAETRDITPVIALPATVKSSTQYKITADFNGTVHITQDKRLQVAGGAGQLQEVDLQGVGVSPELLVTEGSNVSKGTPLISATHDGFTLVAPVSGATLLRFLQAPSSARGQVEGVSEPFDCQLLDEIPSTENNESFISCHIPPSQRVIEALPGILAVRFDTVQNATVLPVEAVAGTIDSGTVFRKTSTGMEEIKVKLGVVDGTSIQISEGISPGDEVVVPSPSMLAGD